MISKLTRLEDDPELKKKVVEARQNPVPYKKHVIVELEEKFWETDWGEDKDKWIVLTKKLTEKFDTGEQAMARVEELSVVARKDTDEDSIYVDCPSRERDDPTRDILILNE